MPSLPLELVHEIVSYACTPTDETASKATWHSIYPLAIASRAYRGIALEGWFRVLRLLPTNIHPVDENCMFRRATNSIPPGISVSSIDFTYVRFNHPPLPNRQASVLQVFANTPPNIVELDLRHLLWPRPDVFSAVAAVFPALEVWSLQYLLQSRAWLELFLRSSCTRTGLDYQIHYARALSPLVHLHTVTITVPYTEGAHIALDSKDLWAGECDSCVEMLYGDPDFLDKWSARKRGVVTSGEDESRKAYIKPPSLRIVEWVLQAKRRPRRRNSG
ncbi:hypothetical protein C8F01DRAFT_1089064 [Mycena amicta]|nr:hypothetical protein C8F01DRAFT_1089064 [Mycena amicta]